MSDLELRAARALAKAVGHEQVTPGQIAHYREVVRQRWAAEAKRDREPPIKDADIHHKLDEISDLVEELRDMIRSR